MQGEGLEDYTHAGISHFIPARFGESFFKEFDLAMQLKRQDLKMEGKVAAEVSEVMEEDITNTFSRTKDHMMETAKMMGAEGNTKN